MVQTYEKPGIRPVFALINVIAASDEGRKEGANQRRSEWPTLNSLLAVAGRVPQHPCGRLDRQRGRHSDLSLFHPSTNQGPIYVPEMLAYRFRSLRSAPTLGCEKC
jgi:hypothetical protein